MAMVLSASLYSSHSRDWNSVLLVVALVEEAGAGSGGG